MRGRGFFAQNLSTASFNHATTGKGAEKVYCPGILFYLIRDVMMLTQGTKAWGIFGPFQAYDRWNCAHHYAATTETLQLTTYCKNQRLCCCLNYCNHSFVAMPQQDRYYSNDRYYVHVLLQPQLFHNTTWHRYYSNDRYYINVLLQPQLFHAISHDIATTAMTDITFTFYCNHTLLVNGQSNMAKNTSTF